MNSSINSVFAIAPSWVSTCPGVPTLHACRFIDRTLYERTQWKHPFNLACASALAKDEAKDEATTELALREALARDREAVAAKAAHDGDLAVYPASAALLSELDKQLTAKLGLHPRILASLASVNGNGERSIYAVYDYSLFDQCVEVRGESQDECIERLGPGEDDSATGIATSNARSGSTT